MPYDGNGNASLNPGYFVQNGDTIVPSQHNPPLEDIVGMLNQVLLRNGAAPLSGNLNANGNKVTNLAEPTNPSDAARLSDLSGGTEVVYEQSGFVISSTTPLDITGISTEFYSFDISVECSSVSSATSDVALFLSIGSGGQWFDIPSSVVYYMAIWLSGGSTNQRRSFATLQNVNDSGTSIFYTAYRSNNVPPSQINYFVTPAEFALRPIDALRIRVVTTGTAKTVNVSKLHITGVRK